MFFDAVDRVRGWLGAWQFQLPSPAQLVKASFFLLILAGWYALTIVPESSSHAIRVSPDEGFRVAQSSPVFGLASRLEDNHWTIVHCDDTPSQCGDVSGYTVVLQHVWLVSPPDNSFARPEFRQTYQELFLVPVQPTGVPDEELRIRWNRLNDEPPAWIEEEGDRTVRYLGTSHGYAVYGKMTVPQLELAHQRLGTDGGSDLLALLEDRHERCGSEFGRLKILRLIASHDHVAVPVLRRAIARSCECSRYSICSLLVRIPGPESASLIRELCADPNMRVHVYRALSTNPYRAELEPIYSSGMRAAVWNSHI
ncbi:MAG: hypothetical protein KJ060_05135 [Candidatus Hydrogenedentes bacterium]|nr:hypothetical protein [Candidatus Hydrogenedentota bacterium]